MEAEEQKDLCDFGKLFAKKDKFGQKGQAITLLTNTRGIHQPVQRMLEGWTGAGHTLAEGQTV